MPITFGLAAQMANLDWWTGLDPQVQTILSDGLRALEDDIFALAATETETGIACNTDGPCPEGEPAGMTLVPVTEADDALRRDALTSVILPAFAERCGAGCAATWNETIGATMGLAID